MKKVLGAGILLCLGLACASGESDKPGSAAGGSAGVGGGTGGVGGGTGGVSGGPGSCAAGQTSCNGVCTSTASDSANCGTCGNACGIGSACVSGSCVCQSGLTDCNGACVDTQEDGANCGTCGNDCAAAGQVCNGGSCSESCSEGLEACGASCVNVMTSVQHCGECNNACSSGGCQNGSCTCPTGQTRCSDGTCATTCDDDPDYNGPATTLNCDDPVYGQVTIPAGNVISDFAGGQPSIYAHNGRGENARPWHAYAAGDVNDPDGEVRTPSASNPKHASNDFEVDASNPGPCNSGGSLHISSPGNEEWGVGFGIDFMARTADHKKQTYDASAYTGIGFWAKCTRDLEFAFMKVVDGPEDADAVGSTCTYGSATDESTCNQYGVKNSVITKDWTYYKLHFDELLQDPNNARFTDGVDKSKLTAFQIHANLKSNRAGTLSANGFECWIDDVHFLSDPPPPVPTSTVTYTTQGNRILRNGTHHILRGMTRPSMEWDMSGFGVTREDIQRMKSWGINVVRLPVIDTFWLGAKAEIYKKNVDRAIKWVLQQDMDVILDLHHVDGLPGSHCTQFWQDVVANSGYANNGRIIFELYNEPGLYDWGTVRTAMQGLYDIIRNAGANNLVLIGSRDWSFDLSGVPANPITNPQNRVAYVTHPYVFKWNPTASGNEGPFINTARSFPVVATEFGDANISSNYTAPDDCDVNAYANTIAVFEREGISWTGWAWIVDEWGCGFPQLIADYSGEPNAIGVPVRDALLSH